MLKARNLLELTFELFDTITSFIQYILYLICQLIIRQYYVLIPIFLLLLLENKVDLNYILLTILLFGLMFIVINKVNLWLDYQFSIKRTKIRASYHVKIMLTRIEVPLKKLYDEDFNAKFKRVNRLIENEQEGIYRLLNNILQFPIVIFEFFLYVTLISYVNSMITILIITISVCNYFIQIKFNNYLFKLYGEIGNYYYKKEALERNIRQYEMHLELYYNEAAFLLTQKIDKIINKINYTQKKINRIELFRSFFSSTLKYIVLLLVLLLLLLLQVNDQISVITLLLVYTFVSSLYDRINDLVSLFSNFNFDLTMMEELNNLQVEVESGKSDIFDEEIETIEFQNVSFKYPNTSEYVLNDFNLVLEKGKKYALIGQNGEGKSTLINLLFCMYEPLSGKIKVNGKDITQYTNESIQSKIGVIFQDNNIMPTKYKDNINFSADDFNMERYSTIKSGFSVTNRFENKLDCYLTKLVDFNGVELSGGQKQQIGILRGLYSIQNIYVFDEPTSELDPLTENTYYQIINSKLREKTVIFTTHRMAACKFVDQIIYIENGHVAELGNHDELMELNGKYKKFCYLQERKKEDYVP